MSIAKLSGALLSFAIPMVAYADVLPCGYDYDGWNMMGTYGGTMMGGFFGIGALFMIAFWALIIYGIAVVIRWISRSGGIGQNRAVDTLDERFARGEITKEEYLERRKVLETGRN